ncbi:MAG: PSD1 domain-containing protein, partial [Planctomycetes bacterium]|nr:PSD1 domain-containing protein [Planctomycetota bacterium]
MRLPSSPVQRCNPGLVLVLAVLTLTPARADEAAPSASSAETAVTFEQHVRPILKAHCFQCHGEGDELEGGLDLRLRRLIAKGGESGPALAEGNRDQSLIYQRVRDQEMPPGDKKLSPAEVEVIGAWLAGGARTFRPEPEEVTEAALITEEDRRFWSFQPIRRPEVPQVKGEDRVRTPIDAFLLGKLEAQGLSFSPEADKITLARRAALDLTGLPLSPEELTLFLADEADDAFDRLIDRLMASPHYGERWGRHWLDVAGYADSEGYNEEDPVRQFAYKYRDYVIRSFNADKPWNQFIVEQLAGDELVPQPFANLSPEQIELLTATGFLRMAPDGTGSRGVEQPVARNQMMADSIQIVSTSLLGLTVACAQCHDHRFDPILQSDYYRLRAIFEPALDWKNWLRPDERQISLATEADRRLADEIEREAAVIDRQLKQKEQETIELVFQMELQKLPAELRDAAREARGTPERSRTPEQKKLLLDYPNVDVRGGGALALYLELFEEGRKIKADAERQLAEAARIRARKPKGDYLRAVWETPGKTPPTYLFHRGDHEQPKQEIAPGELTVLTSFRTNKIAPDDPALPTTGRRLAFARSLTDGAHPLTARVLVNRIWSHHFGRGLVGSMGDFGTQGERPLHPELLDWLASEFMDGGWKLKRLHKLIMTSTAYRQTSRRDPRLDAIDPDNRLYGRMPVRRLEAEVIRDSILAVSGRLNPQMFGPPIPVKEDDSGEVIVATDGASGASTAAFRRSLYVQVRRSEP